MSIIAYEIDFYVMISNEVVSRDREIVMILMWSAFSFNMIHAVSLLLKQLVFFKWLFLKKMITPEDTLVSTGYWKSMAIELIV